MNSIDVVGKEQFDIELASFDGIVVVEFYGPGCGPCVFMSRSLLEAQIALGDNAFKLIRVNFAVTENMSIAIPYYVMSLPTTIIFVGGNKVHNLLGSRSKDEVIEIIERLSTQA